MTFAPYSRLIATFCAWFGMDALAQMPDGERLLPPLVARSWSPLARLVVAINIDRATPGGMQ